MKKKKMVAVNVCAEISRCIRLIGGIVLIMASPFAWILRDGLGPNAHATSNTNSQLETGNIGLGNTCIMATLTKRCYFVAFLALLLAVLALLVNGIMIMDA